VGFFAVSYSGRKLGCCVTGGKKDYRAVADSFCCASPVLLKPYSHAGVTEEFNLWFFIVHLGTYYVAKHGCIDASCVAASSVLWVCAAAPSSFLKCIT